jgi:hypothetical protein
MPPQGQEFGFGILVKLRRLAIRAAKFEPEADYADQTECPETPSREQALSDRSWLTKD